MDVKDCYVCQYRDRGISEKPCCECIDHSKYIKINGKDVELMRSEVDRYCEETGCHDCVLKGDQWKHVSYHLNAKDICLDYSVASKEELEKALALIEASKNENPAIEIEEKKEEMVHHPDHYAKGRKFEPKDVIRDWDLNFNLGSALKYIARAGRKDDIIQDLEKAIEYISFEIEALKEENEDE